MKRLIYFLLLVVALSVSFEVLGTEAKEQPNQIEQTDLAENAILVTNESPEKSLLVMPDIILGVSMEKKEQAREPLLFVVEKIREFEIKFPKDSVKPYLDRKVLVINLNNKNNNFCLQHLLSYHSWYDIG